MHTTRQSIPTFPVVADGLKNAELSNKVQLELFDAQVHFLSLAAVWRTIQILENHKQGGKSTRRRRLVPVHKSKEASQREAAGYPQSQCGSAKLRHRAKRGEPCEARFDARSASERSSEPEPREGRQGKLGCVEARNE